MVNRKERIRMNMIGGYIDGSVSGQKSLDMKLDGNHELNILVYEQINLCTSTNRWVNIRLAYVVSCKVSMDILR